MFPFEYVAYDFASSVILCFYNCTFKEDFGPFQKGRFYDKIEFDTLDLVLKTYDISGHVLDEQKVKLSLV